MSERPWYRRYGADFVHGTLRMTLEEKGAYSICLDLIYDKGGPIPDDARWLAHVCNVSVRKWNLLRASLIKSGKLRVVDGQLTNDRAEKQIENDAKTAQKLAENGAKGGNKKAENQPVSNENKQLALAGLAPSRARVPLPEPYKEKEKEMGGEKRVRVGISDDRWRPLCDRFRRERGRPPPMGTGGWDFPEGWVHELEGAA
jgi:uncharacterized protein YdaU (DUF1376 family)